MDARSRHSVGCPAGENAKRASGTCADDATSRARMRRGPGELARQAPTASLSPAGLPPRSTGEGRTPPCGPFAGIPQCPGG